MSNLLNKNIDTFSYSHGHYTDFGIKVLKDMGFKNAVTIEPRSVTKEDNAFCYHDMMLTILGILLVILTK